MTALIVVESMFGNSRSMAEQIARGIGESMPVRVENVSETQPIVDTDVSLLVVGGPTHAFGMSREMTREEAVSRGSSASPVMGVREWLDAMVCSPGLAVAAFDTRVNKRFVPGSAARAILRRLRQHGAIALTAPITFYVADIEGPLEAGEDARALAFGRQLVSDLERGGLSRDSA